jgi:hypothetical protein
MQAANGYPGERPGRRNPPPGPDLRSQAEAGGSTPRLHTILLPDYGMPQ